MKAKISRLRKIGGSVNSIRGGGNSGALSNREIFLEGKDTHVFSSKVMSRSRGAKEGCYSGGLVESEREEISRCLRIEGRLNERGRWAVTRATRSNGTGALGRVDDALGRNESNGGFYFGIFITRRGCFFISFSSQK